MFCTSKDGTISGISAVNACWDPREKFLSRDQRVGIEALESGWGSSV